MGETPLGSDSDCYSPHYIQPNLKHSSKYSRNMLISSESVLGSLTDLWRNGMIRLLVEDLGGELLTGLVAFEDGNPRYRVNIQYQALMIPEGEHEARYVWQNIPAVFSDELISEEPYYV